MNTSKISGSDISLLMPDTRRTAGKKSDTETDRVELSGSASLLDQATAKALAAPDIDMDKVESVRRAIANGELKIDTDRLAQKMLELEDSIFGTEAE